MVSILMNRKTLKQGANRARLSMATAVSTPFTTGNVVSGVSPVAVSSSQAKRYLRFQNILALTSPTPYSNISGTYLCDLARIKQEMRKVGREFLLLSLLV